MGCQDEVGFYHDIGRDGKVREYKTSSYEVGHGISGRGSAHLGGIDGRTRSSNFNPIAKHGSASAALLRSSVLAILLTYA